MVDEWATHTLLSLKTTNDTNSLEYSGKWVYRRGKVYNQRGLILDITVKRRRGAVKGSRSKITKYLVVKITVDI
jgi:hypothetical protein